MCVRSSIAFYGNFNLDMGRSPGFGSTLTDYSALLRLGFPPAPDLGSLTLPASEMDKSTFREIILDNDIRLNAWGGALWKAWDNAYP